MNAVKEYVLNKGSSPWVNGIAAVLSVLAGALASFFTSSIRLSLALPADPNVGNIFRWSNWHLTVEATVFWALVFSAAGLFALTKYSDTKTDNEHKDYLSKKLRGLESMPPDAFLAKLEAELAFGREIVGVATASAKTTGGRLPATQIDVEIRKILEAFARIAGAYDDKVDGNYRAYLMGFTRDRPEAKLRNAIDLPNLPLDAQMGFLETFESLCVVLKPEGQRAPVFPGKVDFALPVYGRSAAVEDGNLLPGAPKAYKSGRVYECPSVDALKDRLDALVTDRNQAVALRRFFDDGQGRPVRSFVSLAVPMNKWASRPLELEGVETYGVLTIEASHENIFKSAESFFRPVVQPLLYMLSDLIALRDTSIAVGIDGQHLTVGE
ncbi:hypothetical protein [Paraburkholderia sp. D1E]|uniref:hypothetical protein n=1 Tax=Paraburkholderia sp. D1E TaxID=3461398 RepID=UPI00404638E8